MNRNARTTDPTTSHTAAATINETHTQRLLAAYWDHPEGLTADQAAAIADLLHVGYWKRVSDLARDGIIEPVTNNGQPVTAPGISGRQQRVMRLALNQTIPTLTRCPTCGWVATTNDDCGTCQGAR